MKKSLLIACFLSFAMFVGANDLVKKKKEEARKLLSKGEFVQALPIAEALYLSEPGDAKVQYLLAQSLQVNPEQVRRSIVLLQEACSNLEGDALVKAQSLLATCYHRDYQFDNAIELYQHLDTVTGINSVDMANLKKLSVSSLSNKDYKVLLAQCKQGKELIKTLNSAEIRPVKKFEPKQMVPGYRKVIGRDLWKTRSYQIKPSMLNSVEDDKEKEDIYMHILGGGERRIYAENKINKFGRRDKDIVIESKEKGTDWYEREYVGAIVNSPWDEDYPYLSQDGMTLYFCSNGAESMGGYDIFKCEKDTATGYWGKPINLGFPINTPADELLYIRDTTSSRVYFSSNRFSGVQQMELFEMSIKKYDHIPYSFVFQTKILGGDTVRVKSISVANYDHPEFKSSGISLDNGGQYLFMVNQLERYLVSLVLSDGKQLTYDVFSSSPSLSISSGFQLYKERGAYKLRKKGFSDQKEQAAMINLLLNNSFTAGSKTVKSSVIKNVTIADSLDFDLLAKQLFLLKEELNDRELEFSALYKKVKDNVQALQTWLGVRGGVRGKAFSSHLNSEKRLNAMVVELRLMKSVNEELAVLREEVGMLTKVGMLRDSAVAGDNQYVTRRKLQKVYELFASDFKQLRERHLELLTNRNDFYAKVVALKNSLEYHNHAAKDRNQSIASRVALLNEEKIEAERQYNNAWWKRKKRRLQKVIDDINVDIAYMDSVAQLNKSVTEKRNGSLDLAAVIFKTADYRYQVGKKDTLYRKVIPSFEFGDVLDLVKHQEKLIMKDLDVVNTAFPEFYRIISERENDSMLVQFKISEQQLLESLRSLFREQAKVGEETIDSVEVDLALLNEVNEKIEEELKQQDHKDFAQHQVKSKETIHLIARKYNVSVEEIKRWNAKSSLNKDGIDWSSPKRTGSKLNWLYVGEIIRVVKKYRVKSGDTLKKIAALHGMTKEELKKINTKVDGREGGIDWASDRRTGKRFEWLYVGETLIVK